MSRRKIIDLIENSTNNISVNKQFTLDVQSAIARYEQTNARTGSNNYKPSSLRCMRGMYFTRVQAQKDATAKEYQSIGMADTGTRRHEAIQNVLMNMKSLGYDWEYVDVADYVALKHITGKCENVKVKGKRGVETHLIDETLHVSFMCDGILRRISTNEYFLFEFKNQTSFKYRGKNTVDPAHIDQVTCYCALLDLDKALVLYENRDVCELICPEVLKVTDEMKQNCISKLIQCEEYVTNLTIPEKVEDPSVCKWCDYKQVCKNTG